MARMLLLFLAVALVGCRNGQLVLSQKTVVCGPYVASTTELFASKGDTQDAVQRRSSFSDRR